jgi:hypothetical protein
LAKFRWTGRLLVLVLVAISGVAVNATAAHANTCSPGGVYCGDVVNNSSLYITVTGGTYANPGGWCWGSPTDPDNLPRYGYDPFSCAHYNVNVYPGQHGNQFLDDTDAFDSDAGCVIKYLVTGSAGLPYTAFATLLTTRVDDRRGKTQDKWVKLSDDETVKITYQYCGSAMTAHYVNTRAPASGFQDQWCAQDGTDKTWGGGNRCAADGTLFRGNNYFYCKILGGQVSDSNGAYSYYWLLTDLDAMNDGHDGRSFVSAYYLSGGTNDTSNNHADYWNGSAWVSFPNC